MVTVAVLGWAVIHSAWQAAAVAAALAVFLRVVRTSATQRYAASFGALILTAVLPMVTALTLVAGRGTAIADFTARGSAAGVQGSAPVAVDAALALTAGWVGSIWLVCVLLLLARWAGAWWLVVRRTCRATRPARAAWSGSLRAVAARMGVTSPVELRESTAVDTPTLVGHRRPVVLLPVRVFESLARAEAESILAHELAHVRRADFVANGVQTAVEILFFFHPAVRWISRVVRDQREQCCDDVAVQACGSRLVYARALARLEMLRAPAAGNAFVLGANGGTLLGRLERLAGNGPTAAPGAARLVLLLVTAAAVTCVVVVGLVVLPPTARVLAVSRIAARYTVHARDPAGEFSVTFERSRPTGATVGGVAVAPDRLLTRGDSLFLPRESGDGYFALHLKPRGFTWTPRRRIP